MSTKPVDRFTSEVFARRYLDFGPDASLLVWAENMVLSDFSSDHLYILLGETEPFNKFELDGILDHIQTELKLPEIGSREDALEILATSEIRRFIEGRSSSATTMFNLAEQFMNDGGPDSIRDFYLLHFAAVDIETAKCSPHWPSANEANIEKIIRDKCVDWVEKHSLSNWQEFEYDRNAQLEQDN